MPEWTSESADDDALVTRVAAGDDDALAALYDRHGRAAYGLAVSVIRDRQLAEDAVQNAFLDVWRTAKRRCKRGESMRAWIMLLVHRRSVDLVRREELRRRVPTDMPAPATAASADDDAEMRSTALRVRAALARIPPHERTLLELAYYGGLSQSELALRLGLPLGTVKSRMFSGLARLRDLLADDSISARGTREEREVVLTASPG